MKYTTNTTKPTKPVSTAELFERYVKICDVTNAQRHDAREFLKTEFRKRDLEKLIRDRLSFTK